MAEIVMDAEILMNVTPTETRVAVVENGVLQEIFIERTNHLGIVGNIYKVSEAPLFVINQKFRYRIIIKSPYKKVFYDKIFTILIASDLVNPLATI